jgi:hypothetical protein
VFKALFDPGTQAVGVANSFPKLPFQIGHDVPHALRRERLWIGREVVLANAPALPKDDLADVTSVLLAIGEDSFKRPSVGIPDVARLEATRRHDWSGSPPHT